MLTEIVGADVVAVAEISDFIALICAETAAGTAKFVERTV
jgi:hypothetical protein